MSLTRTSRRPCSSRDAVDERRAPAPGRGGRPGTAMPWPPASVTRSAVSSMVSGRSYSERPRAGGAARSRRRSRRPRPVPRRCPGPRPGSRPATSATLSFQRPDMSGLLRVAFTGCVPACVAYEGDAEAGHLLSGIRVVSAVSPVSPVGAQRRRCSVAPGDPFLQVRGLRADRGRLAVAGRTTVSGRQGQQPVPDRVDDRREVGERPAGGAGPALEEGVAGEDARRGPGRTGRPRRARGPGVCSTVRSAPAASITWPSASSASGVAVRVGQLPQRQVVGVQQIGGAGARRRGRARRRCGRCGRGCTRSPAAAGPPTRLGDGVGVVGGVDDDRLVVVADDPHVVVDVPGAAVEA